MEFQLNWARKFGKHDITAMALYNQNDYRYQADLAERYQGLVGRATYGYDDRYLQKSTSAITVRKTSCEADASVSSLLLRRMENQQRSFHERNGGVAEQSEDPCILW